MMSRLTQTQGKRLCELAHLLRPEWDLPGIEAAVRAAADQADGTTVARALLALCANPAARTPGLLPKAGRHWPKDDDGNPLRAPSNDIACPEHPYLVHPCSACKAEKAPLTTTQIESLRELVRSGKEPS